MACGPATAGSMCEASHPASLMAKAGEAIFDRNATSGRHSSNTTVFASVALIRLISPVYGACPESGAFAWPHGASPAAGYAFGWNRPSLGTAVGGTGVGDGAKLVIGSMVGPHAATTSARVARQAAKPRVMRRCAAVKLRDAPDVPSPGRPDGPVPGRLQRFEPSTRMSVAW